MKVIKSLKEPVRYYNQVKEQTHVQAIWNAEMDEQILNQPPPQRRGVLSTESPYDKIHLPYYPFSATHVKGNGGHTTFEN